MTASRPESLLAIDREMARQHADALASFTANREVAARAAASLKKTGRLLMLGMGGSHAVARAVEPYYRALGIDAVSLPVSEQLAAPLPRPSSTPSAACATAPLTATSSTSKSCAWTAVGACSKSAKPRPNTCSSAKR